MVLPRRTTSGPIALSTYLEMGAFRAKHLADFGRRCLEMPDLAAKGYLIASLVARIPVNLGFQVLFQLLRSRFDDWTQTAAGSTRSGRSGQRAGYPAGRSKYQVFVDEAQGFGQFGAIAVDRFTHQLERTWPGIALLLQLVRAGYAPSTVV